MVKYNIVERKQRVAAYRSMVSPNVMDTLYSKILDILLIQKKYKDKEYSAKQLAIDLGTNSRYISAVVNVKFHMNYTSLVNKYRVEEAMSLLTDKRYADMTVEDISEMVGFANRQSFYTAFFKFEGCTPRDYRMMNSVPVEASKDKDGKKKKTQKTK